MVSELMLDSSLVQGCEGDLSYFTNPFANFLETIGELKVSDFIISELVFKYLSEWLSEPLSGLRTLLLRKHLSTFQSLNRLLAWLH